MGRPRRVSSGAKCLFSDGLASARSCLSSSRAETPKLDVRLFLPLRVLLRAFGTSACSVPEASKKPVSVGDSPRGSYIYIKAISGDCLPPNPVMGTEIEISPWIKPVDIRVFVMEACVQCCGVVEAQRQERLGKEAPGTSTGPRMPKQPRDPIAVGPPIAALQPLQNAPQKPPAVTASVSSPCIPIVQRPWQTLDRRPSQHRPLPPSRPASFS